MVEMHNEAGRCRHKGCRSARLAARQLCEKHYRYHRYHGTLQHFTPIRPRRVDAPHVCDHEPAARCYWNHDCRCNDCRRLVNKARAKTKAQRLTGRARTVAAEKVLDHLREQFARPGVTKKQCADATGLSHQFVRDLTNGRVKNITPQVAAILTSWYGTGCCETCGSGTPAYGTTLYCFDCLTGRTTRAA